MVTNRVVFLCSFISSSSQIEISLWSPKQEVVHFYQWVQILEKILKGNKKEEQVQHYMSDIKPSTTNLL